MQTEPNKCPRVQKVWGWTTQIKPDLHFLELEQGGFCSQHYHRHRANIFAVHSGVVHVEWWPNSGCNPRIVRLTKGMSFEVPSLVIHLFRVIEDGTMTEQYYADRGGLCLPDDIVRLVEGGKINGGKHE